MFRRWGRKAMSIVPQDTRAAGAGRVELERFPHPYRAAATVASDIDNSSYDRFAAIHALMTGDAVIRPDSPHWATLGLTQGSAWYDAALGGVRGLGLAMADSFFLIADEISMGLHRYDEAAGRFTEDRMGGHDNSAAIREWLKAGLIDSYHGFMHYTRDQVLPILRDFLDWCDREGVAKPIVWLNHAAPVCPTGMCPRKYRYNRAMLLARKTARWVVGPMFGRERRNPIKEAFRWYYGDKPESQYYINDILAASGLRYIWLNRGPTADTLPNRIMLPEHTWQNQKSILDVVTMDDGVRYFSFDRVYGCINATPGAWPALRQQSPVFDTSVLFTEDNLRLLCERKGTCIMYTHWTMAPSFPLADETIGRFQLLKRFRDEGLVWVAPLRRLLEWTRVRTFLNYEVHDGTGRMVIDIKGVADPISGPVALTADECRGLAFRLPPGTKAVEIRLAGRTDALGAIRREGDVCWIP